MLGGGGGARGQNLEHLQKVVFLCWSLLELYIFATIYQKAIILEPYVPSMVHAGGKGGGGSRSKSRTSSKSSISVLEFSRSLYLCNHLSERYQRYPTLPLLNLPYLYPPLPHPYPTLPCPSLPQPYPTLTYPTLPFPTLPFPSLPFPFPTHSYPYPHPPYPYPTPFPAPAHTLPYKISHTCM